MPLEKIEVEGHEIVSDEFEIHDFSGRHVMVTATLSFVHVLDNIQSALRSGDFGETFELYHDALNAHVAQAARMYNSAAGNDITQIGINKFFVNSSFEKIEIKEYDVRTRTEYSTIADSEQFGVTTHPSVLRLPVCY